MEQLSIICTQHSSDYIDLVHSKSISESYIQTKPQVYFKTRVTYIYIYILVEQ